jgi:hypothetical protein
LKGLAMGLKINVDGERYYAHISFKQDFDINSASELEILYLMKTLARLLELLDDEVGPVNPGNSENVIMRRDEEGGL